MAIDPQISPAWLQLFPFDFLRWLQDNFNNLQGINLRGLFANPNGHVAGIPGDIYTYNNNGAATLWLKQSGINTLTGWVQVTVP